MSRERSILHVDDDPAVTRLVAEVLVSRGYAVTSVNDPRHAVRALLQGGQRVVILDIDMPGASGLELLSEIKAQDGGVQVIMLSGLVTMTSVLQSMARGANACLFKPLTSFEPLLHAVHGAFDVVDQWWATLAELRRRRLQDLPPAREALVTA